MEYRSVLIGLAKAAVPWVALSFGDALVSQFADRVGLLDTIMGLRMGQVPLAAGLVLYCVAMGAIAGFAIYYTGILLFWLWRGWRMAFPTDRDIGRIWGDKCIAEAAYAASYGPGKGRTAAFLEGLREEGFDVPLHRDVQDRYLDLLGHHLKQFGFEAGKAASADFARGVDADRPVRRNWMGY